ncbi:MAG: hypothetical protein KDB35_17600 [Acidimicrobiales bacterium]|nr:hypothetical protein [Acidimicrobiales bacterium]
MKRSAKTRVGVALAITISLALVVGLVVASTLWFDGSSNGFAANGGEDARESSSPAEAALQQEAGAEGTSTGDVDSGGESGPIASDLAPKHGQVEDETRLPATLGGIRGRVMDANGDPIEGASLVWTPLRDEWTGPSVHWSMVDWAVVEKVSSGCQSDDLGRFALVDPPAGVDDTDSAIWISRPGYAARSVLVPAGESASYSGRDWDLEVAPDVSIVVRDAAGAAVNGASILVHGDPDRAVSREEKETARYRAFKVFCLRGVTSTDGHLSLPSTDIVCEVHAEQGAQKSDYWTGAFRGSIVLALGRTFRASGRVTGELRDISLEPPAVIALALENELHRRLAVAPVREDGGWGPVELPILDIDAYRFRLAGGGWTSTTKSIQLDEVRDPTIVDFEATRGHSLDVLVTTSDEVPIAAARADAYWLSNGDWEGVAGTAGLDGRVPLQGIPAGTLWIRAWRDGYESTSLDEHQFDPRDVATTSVNLRLRKAGRIVGRCSYRGEPVHDFSLRFWPIAAEDSVMQSVGRSEDGSFEIDAAPLGEVMVTAYTDELPPCDPQRVSVKPGETAEVELELTAGLAVRGTVIDGLTGVGLGSAEVQQLISFQGRGVGGCGSVQPVGSGGEFELFPVRPGACLVAVTADGYAGGRRVLRATGGAPADAQLVPLYPYRPLRVQLTSDGPVDFTQFRALVSEHGGPHRFFDEEGFLELGSVTRGAYTLQVVYPDDSSQDVQFQIESGMDALLQVSVEWYPTFEVELVPADGQEVPDRCWVRVEGGYEGLRRDSRSFFAGGRAVTVIDRVPPGPAMFVVVDPDNTVLGRTFAVVQPDPVPRIRIELGAADRRFRIVDRNGEPMPDVRVNVWEADTLLIFDIAITDGTGTALVRDLGEPRVRLWLDSPEIGSVLTGPIDLAREEDPVEVVYEAECSLRVTLVDGGVPVVAADTDVLIPPDISASGTFLTGGDGSVSWTGLGVGRHIVRTRGLACWPAQQDVELAPGENSVTMQVMRRGSLRLEVRDASGAPVAGARVGLVSRELQEAVGDWIAAELVPGDEATLVGDAEGVVTVHGLPRGVYDWRVVGPESGAVATGSVVVPPQAVGSALLTVE